MSILIVEDDRDLAESIRALLHSRGYEVWVATDGVYALELARREPPELVLLDALLPRLSGFDFCRLLREDPSLRKVRVLMLTALSGVGDMDQAFASGVDDFISKPFESQDLLGKVARLMAGPRPPT